MPHIQTTTDIIEIHGDPAEGAGSAEGSWLARKARREHQEQLESIVSSLEQRGGAVDPNEQRAFDAHRTQVERLDVLAQGYEARRNREADVRAGTNTEWRTQGFGGTFTSGGTTYRKDDPHGRSWLADMAAFALRGEPDAADRLRRNDREVATEHRALSTTDGAGGDFAPPLWMVQQFVDLARASRVTADLVHHETLPPGTDQINIPRIVTGTAVAEQAVQNTAVQNTDLTTGSVGVNVATLAGQQVVPLQLIEQSPINVDQMVLQDLLGDLSAKIDLFVLNNTAVNKKGLLQETGTNAVTFTSTTPTVALFYSKLADAVRQVSVNTFKMPTAIVMSPMRWAWILAASDTGGRPLVVPEASGPYNSFGTTQTAATDGRVGSMMGLPVYVDPQIPSNLGVGTNQDVVIVMTADESILWEGALKAEAFRETRADQLSLLVRTYQYVAFTAARRPKSISLIQGTGLVQPTL